MGVGQFSCDNCGKSYAWKPQLAGKRVKCKCGSPLSVPKTDPAAHDDGGLDDLAALAHGGDAYDDAPAAAGPRCPSCGEGVDPSAVICINCGTNLKTGKRLATATVAAAPPMGGGKPGKAGSPVYDRAFGVKAVGDEDKMSPQNKKILAAVLSVVLIAILATVIIVVQNAKKKEAERQARLNAGPRPKLERMLTAAEKSGGLTQAIKDGTLYEEMSKDEPPPPPRAKWSKDAINGEAQGIGHFRPNDEAKNWVTRLPDAAFHGMNHDESVKLVETLYDKYKCRHVQVILKAISSPECDQIIVTVPDLPKEMGGTADGPYRKEYWKWAQAFMTKIGQECPPDLEQYYMVFRLKKGGGGTLASGDDEDEEDMEDADAEEDEDDEGFTPAKPRTKKPKKPAPGAKPDATAKPQTAQ